MHHIIPSTNANPLTKFGYHITFQKKDVKGDYILVLFDAIFLKIEMWLTFAYEFMVNKNKSEIIIRIRGEMMF